jgi:hypothetical protein
MVFSTNTITGRRQHVAATRTHGWGPGIKLFVASAAADLSVFMDLRAESFLVIMWTAAAIQPFLTQLPYFSL